MLDKINLVDVVIRDLKCLGSFYCEIILRSPQDDDAWNSFGRFTDTFLLGTKKAVIRKTRDTLVLKASTAKGIHPAIYDTKGERIFIYGKELEGKVGSKFDVKLNMYDNGGEVILSPTEIHIKE